jgi:hypothetical protein
VTTPAREATDGPIATGKPVTYTVTGPGSVTTQTAFPPNSPRNGDNGGPNIAAIVAGTAAGVLFVVALYLGFCAYVYRRQLVLYKNHVAAVQRSSAGSRTATAAEKPMVAPAPSSDAFGPFASSSGGQPPDNRGRMDTPGGVSAGDDRRGSTAGLGRQSTAYSSTENLIAGQEPTFLGVMLNPRRSLRVINN